MVARVLELAEFGRDISMAEGQFLHQRSHPAFFLILFARCRGISLG